MQLSANASRSLCTQIAPVIIANEYPLHPSNSSPQSRKNSPPDVPLLQVPMGPRRTWTLPHTSSALLRPGSQGCSALPAHSSLLLSSQGPLRHLPCKTKHIRFIYLLWTLLVRFLPQGYGEGEHTTPNPGQMRLAAGYWSQPITAWAGGPYMPHRATEGVHLGTERTLPWALGNRLCSIKRVADPRFPGRTSLVYLNNSTDWQETKVHSPGMCRSCSWSP